MEIRYIPTNDEDAEGLQRAQRRCYDHYLKASGITNPEAHMSEFDFNKGFQYGVGWIIQRRQMDLDGKPLSNVLGDKMPPEWDDLTKEQRESMRVTSTGQCRICGQGEEADHGPCIDIAMRRLADQHNLQHNAHYLVMEQLRQEWKINHAYHRKQHEIEGIRSSQISALVMLLIKKGVIDGEKVIYDHHGKGRQAEAVRKDPEETQG